MTDVEAFYSALLEDDPEELYENAPCAYLSARPDGTITKVNRTFLAWTGYDLEEVVGQRRFQELLAPGDRIFYETHFAPLLRMQGHVREIAVELICRSGARLPVLANSVLDRDERGEPTVVRTAIFDATERRAYEQELLAARQRAEASEARARALARTLQESFLPPEIVHVPGLELGGAYRPAGDGTEVGGDFYDVVETGRGHWAIVLGDVCGKGVGAAVVTSLARYTVRAEALRTRSPRAVLTAVHDALVRYHPEQFCTALLVDIEPVRRGARMVISSGGHHLPIRVRGDGTAERIGEAGSILGMLDEAFLQETVVELEAQDVVVLYTDGVLEARHGREFFDEDRLLAVIRETASQPAQEIANAVVAAALDFQNGDARDDIAVVVIRVPG